MGKETLYLLPKPRGVETRSEGDFEKLFETIKRERRWDRVWDNITLMGEVVGAAYGGVLGIGNSFWTHQIDGNTIWAGLTILGLSWTVRQLVIDDNEANQTEAEYQYLRGLVPQPDKTVTSAEPSAQA